MPAVFFAHISGLVQRQDKKYSNLFSKRNIFLTEEKFKNFSNVLCQRRATDSKLWTVRVMLAPPKKKTKTIL